MKVAVVGGGIAGLAAAWELRGRAEVVIHEPGPLGGRIRTTDFAGRPVDEGPDAFITRSPEAAQLCAELDLSGDLVAPAAGRTLLWWRGGLHALPAGLVLGVPRDLRPVATSGLLSPRGMLRAALDLALPASRFGPDVSVAELVSKRFGHQVDERLVEPLVGSIHAARTADLSASMTVPQVLEAARRSRSLLLALRTAQAAPPGPLFLTPRRGLGALVARLAERLASAGVRVVASPVTAVRPAHIGVALDGERYDAAILAVPAAEAGRLLGDAGAGLGAIGATSVGLVTFDYGGDLPVPAGVNGILVPPGEGRLMTACSFGSNKWPHWANPGHAVLRVSVGREGDDRWQALDDDDLAGRLAEELRLALGTTAQPSAWRVSRWDGAFPHYRVGHPSYVRAVTALLQREAPGIRLAGASYTGAGIPACVASGRIAAAGLLGR